MKSKLSAFATLMGAILPICCVSCESAQQKEEVLSIEVVSSDGNQYTCTWEEEITLEPLHILYCSNNGTSDWQVIGRWFVSSKLHIEQKYFRPMDVLKIRVECTFETNDDPTRYVRDVIVPGKEVEYIKAIPAGARDPSPIRAYFEYLETNRSTIGRVEETRIVRSQDGRIVSIGGNAISASDKICCKDIGEVSLPEATCEEVFVASSVLGEKRYFDFNPDLELSHFCLNNYPPDIACPC